MNRKVPDNVMADQPIWLQIAPYGTYPGEKMSQVIDAKALDQLVANFSGDVLVDIDHRSIGGKDTAAAGWIKAIKADPDDGLLAEFHFTPKGVETVLGKEYRYLSPFWLVGTDGRPKRLASVALTNTPNLPVAAMTNSAEPQALTPTKDDKMDKLKELLKLGPDASDDDVVAAVSALIKQVGDLKAKALDAEASEFAEANAAICKDKNMLANCYKLNPKVARAMVANIKVTAPEKAPEGNIFVANSATQVPNLDALPMSHDEMAAALNALPPGERKAFYSKHSHL